MSRATGFSQQTKLGVRTRAGLGNPDYARCECHGLLMGLYEGEIQHRVARGMGGRGFGAPWWINHLVNALLMCIPGHRLAESRSPEMHENGFWLWSSEEPHLVPVLLYGQARKVWLNRAGGYSTEPPPEGEKQ